MFNEDPHISDQELLQAADGEMAGSRAGQIQAHLEACWSCRSRRAEIEQTITDFVHAYSGYANADVPPIEGPRALLRARLRHVAANRPPTLWDRMRQFVLNSRGLSYAGLALAAAALFVIVVRFSMQTVEAVSTPNARLTPGATRFVTRNDVCSVRNTEGFYPIPATLAYRVFEKYGIENPRPRSYEVDYLITPALGGADDIRNLWPQPYAAGPWNAHIKDALEDHLHRLVCQGTLDLSTAQRDISANWIDAYKKYFQTERPLAIHASFIKDPPWEQ